MENPASGQVAVADGDLAITLAQYACSAEDKTVSLEKDTVVTIRKVLDSGWVYVIAQGGEPARAGYFPGAYLKKITKEEAVAIGKQAAQPNPPSVAPLPAPIVTPKPSPPPSRPVPSPHQSTPPVTAQQQTPSPTAPIARAQSPSASNLAKSAGLQKSSKIKSIQAGKGLQSSESLRVPDHRPISPKGGSAIADSSLRERASTLAAPTATRETGTSLGESVADANSRFQDYVVFQSRLINKYKTSLEAQTNLMDANNQMAICIHEFGKKLAGSSQDDGDANLGTCMMKISEVLMAQERLKSQQRAAEQEMVQHFLDFVNITAPEVRSQKYKFDQAQQEYLDASLRLREMGMKSKVKLENVKVAETEKAEKKTAYHNITVNLLDNLKVTLHDENAALLGQYAKWMDALKEANETANRNLNRDMMFVGLWRRAIGELGKMKEQQKKDSQDLMKSLNSDCESSSVVLLGPKAKATPLKTVQDPVQKLLDILIRDERKYVHRVAAIQNLYLFELKKEPGLLSSEDERKIFMNIGDIIEFHNKLLKGLEKAYNCWPFPHLAGLFLDIFKTEAFVMYGTYMEKVSGSRSHVKKMRKKDPWRSLCKGIQQRHDIESLSDLLVLPQNRLERYIKFLGEYLESIPETEPDYSPATDTLQHFEDCLDDIVTTSMKSAKSDLDRWGGVVSGIDLCNEAEVKCVRRMYIHRGSAEVRCPSDQRFSSNFILLCSDQLVCCQRESKSNIKFVASLYLYEMEVKPCEDNVRFILASPEAEYLFTVSEAKEKKVWTSHLTRLIEIRLRRFKIIGMPLCVIIRREKDRSIPAFLKEAFSVVLKNKTSEGIFRLSGEKRRIKQATLRLNQGMNDVFTNLDEHSVAGVIKQFFRELPEPLLTWDLYQDFIDCVRKSEDSTERANSISALVDRLPRGNRLILMFLIKLLSDVKEEEPSNKMSAHNLSIVFGPNLLRAKSESASASLSDYPAAVVGVMIQQYSTIFSPVEKEFEIKFDMSGLDERGRQVRLNDYRRSFRSQKFESFDEPEIDDDDDEEADEDGMLDTRATLGTIVKEGWLSKKGDVRRAWHKRWFVLKYGSLAYFKTQDGVNAQGRIILVDCLVGQSTSKKANCFAITTPSKRTFLLTAANPREQAEWMQAIQGCIESSF